MQSRPKALSASCSGAPHGGARVKIREETGGQWVHATKVGCTEEHRKCWVFKGRAHLRIEERADFRAFLPSEGNPHYFVVQRQPRFYGHDILPAGLGRRPQQRNFM